MSMVQNVSVEDIIVTLIAYNMSSTDEEYEGAFNYVCDLLSISQDKLAEMVYDGVPEENKIQKTKSVKYPCRNCVYFNQCGDNMRTHPCAGRQTKSERKKRR